VEECDGEEEEGGGGRQQHAAELRKGKPRGFHGLNASKCTAGTGVVPPHRHPRVRAASTYRTADTR